MLHCVQARMMKVEYLVCSKYSAHLLSEVQNTGCVLSDVYWMLGEVMFADLLCGWPCIVIQCG